MRMVLLKACHPTTPFINMIGKCMSTTPKSTFQFRRFLQHVVQTHTVRNIPCHCLALDELIKKGPIAFTRPCHFDLQLPDLHSLECRGGRCDPHGLLQLHMVLLDLHMRSRLSEHALL